MFSVMLVISFHLLKFLSPKWENYAQLKRSLINDKTPITFLVSQRFAH